MRITSTAVAFLAMTFTTVSAQSLPVGDSGREVPVRMIVTAEPLRSQEVPSVGRDDIKAMQEKTALAVTEWAPLQGEMAAMELYILVDESADPGAAARFDEIRSFILSQPATAAIGIAYMDNGAARIVQTPVKDHALAAKALRLPSGNQSALANPFTSLSALINGWAPGAPRREVVMVTDGIDRFEDTAGESEWIDFAVADAQRAGVPVFCLYAPGLGHSSHSPALIRGGQDYLGQLAEQTGGEAYFKEGGPSPSFDSYLADIAQHLAHQFRVTFLATPAEEQTASSVVGKGFQRVAFRSQGPNVELISARGFYLSREKE